MEQKDWMIPTGVGIGSFIFGIGIGYAISNYRQKKSTRESEFEIEKSKFASDDSEYETEDGDNGSGSVQLSFELEESRRLHQRDLQYVKPIIQELRNVIDQLKDEGEIYLGRFTNPDEPVNKEEDTMNIVDDDPPIVSIFRNGDDSDWNYDVELANRNPEIPYTIHRDEFFENEYGHRQSQLTYYKGDNILCDELDSPIYDPERVVGTLEFGRGSQDPNIVYVRNVKLDADYEVVLDHGYYQVEVLGQAHEDVLNAENLKHSVHKFRME